MFGRTVHSPWFLRKCAGRSNEQAGILGARRGYPCLAAKTHRPSLGSGRAVPRPGSSSRGMTAPALCLHLLVAPAALPARAPVRRRLAPPVLAAPRRSSEGRCAPPPQVVVARSRRGAAVGLAARARELPGSGRRVVPIGTAS